MDIQEIKKKITADVQAVVTAKIGPLAEEIRRLKESYFTALGTLEQKIKITVEAEVTAALDSQISALSAAAAPPPPPATAGQLGPSLFESLQAIDHGRSQVEILSLLLASAHEFAPRVLLTVLKGETLMGWSAKGFKMSEADIKKMTINLNTSSCLKQVVDSAELFWGDATSHADNAMLFRTLGGVLPREILVTPLVLKGKVMAVIYCDDGGIDGAMTNVEPVKIMAWSASNSIDSLSFRARVTRPLPGAPAAAAPAPAPVPAPAPAQHPAAPPTPISRDPRAGTNPDIMFAPTERAAPPPVAAEPMSPEEKKRHDDAKRLARVLVADLILYHRSEVEVGRRNKDLYQRLREDLDRSRQTYLERVGPEMAAKTNYLYEELVKTLADGHPAALAGY